ncbi:hypothetical protein [Methylobacterium sp. CM6257]
MPALRIAPSSLVIVTPIVRDRSEVVNKNAGGSDSPADAASDLVHFIDNRVRGRKFAEARGA